MYDKKEKEMKKILMLSLLFVVFLSSLFSNDFEGKVYQVKSGPTEYKNQEWQFTDSTLFISDAKEGKYTAYEYDVSGSTISIKGLISDRLEDFLHTQSMTYTLSEGTAVLQIEFNGNSIKLFDTGREADRKAMASNILDKSVAVSGMITYGVSNIKSTSDNFTETLDYAKANGGKARDGYVGNRDFSNREGKLPTIDSSGNPIIYKEYDVNPYVPGVNRGAERLVIGSDGNAYKTVDHYKTFELMQKRK